MKDINPSGSYERLTEIESLGYSLTLQDKFKTSVVASFQDEMKYLIIFDHM